MPVGLSPPESVAESVSPSPLARVIVAPGVVLIVGEGLTTRFRVAVGSLWHLIHGSLSVGST